jgi:hypothetical protein
VATRESHKVFGEVSRLLEGVCLRELGRPAPRACRPMHPASQSGYAQNSSPAVPASEYSLTSTTFPSTMRNTFADLASKTLPLRSP